MGSPVKIRAIPVEDTLSILIKREEEKANQRKAELLAKKKMLLEHFSPSRKSISEDELQFSLLSERAAILSKASSVIKSAGREVLITSSRQKIIQILLTFAEILKKAMNRHVKLRIIKEFPEDEDQIPRILEEQISPDTIKVKLKYAESLLGHFMIVDNKEMMISTLAENFLAEHPSLWTNSPALIEPLRIASKIYDANLLNRHHTKD